MYRSTYNPDFWEVIVDHSVLERMSEERGIWFESFDDRQSRYELEERHLELSHYVNHNLLGTLTRKQREAFLLYFQHGKTQQEIAEILGMSRRFVSQHLFGIRRNGKHVGGAIKKIRSLCRDHGVTPTGFA